MSPDSFSDLLAPFPVRIVIPVAWGEMDAMRHVNNIIYFRYMETARFAYFERLDWVQQSDAWIGPILGSIRCRFRFPLTYPDRVHVGTKVTRIEADRFTMRHLLISERHQRVAAEGEGVIVVFDYGRNRKAERIPPEIRERLEALERDAPALAD
jgi:acyl-CoA thioester hydrolase